MPTPLDSEAGTREILIAVGGPAGCRSLAEAFYARVASDPLLRPLFPGKSFRCAIGELSAFLVQLLGGPREDTQKRWWLSLRESHNRFRIGERERAAWMGHMNATLAAGPEPLRRFFEEVSHYVTRGIQPADSELWAPQEALEKAVAAIAAGNAREAIDHAGRCSPNVQSGLLARMIATRNADLLAWVHEQIRTQPELIDNRHAGRMLLHNAAAAGSTETVELLLRAGVDPNVQTAGGHTPLYCVANECSDNECSRGGGPSVVRILTEWGAAVDAADGVQRCTPLHMAARRGNTEICAALLDCGAGVNTRDRKGDTPLRRAINCKKSEAAELLLGRGGIV